MLKQYEIPDVRDGLTSLQRRILWTMKGIKRASKQPYIRSDRIVEKTGDGENLDGHIRVKNRLVNACDFDIFGAPAIIYDAIILMAQDWRYSLPLIDRHGNCGTPEGYPPAAPIFTECKLSDFSKKVLLIGLNPQTVKYILNPTMSKKEPSVLPARIPNVLVTGTNGGSHIPPHNLGEVIDAAVAMIENPELKPEQLFDYIQGPDFPTGGIIINKSDLPGIYQNGAGEIRIRGRTEIERFDERKKQITIKEIPYTMLGKIREFVEDIKFIKKYDVLPGIKNEEDQSSRLSVKIIITLKLKSDAERVLDLLYEYTDLESNFDYRSLLTSNGKPCLMSLHQILTEWLVFYREIMTKQKHGVPPTNEELIAALQEIKKEFATPRKTKIIDVL